MNREVQGVIMVLFGSATLRISIGDTFLNYVKEFMQPWLIISGAILVILGLFTLADAVRRRPHGHGPASAWFLLVPVLAIFLIAPPALGAYTAARDITNAMPTSTEVLPLPPGDPVELYVSDYINRAVWDDGRTLDGRTVEITGFVTPNPDGGWWLTRMSLACCAADAFAGKIQIVNPPVGWVEPPANTWVVATGRWVPGGGTQSDVAIPLLQTEAIIEIPQPRNPYD